jgi:phosphoribosyl 1,2-cyclic phosphodiesterase
MKCTILGSGDVEGHPIITKPTKYLLKGENKLRPGFLVESGEDTVVFDTGPDIRQQLITAGVEHISAIFITHQHFDHLWGIADVYQLSWAEEVSFPVYVTKDTLEYITKYMPWVKLPFHILEYNKQYQFNGFSVEPVEIEHSLDFESTAYLITSDTGKKIFYAPDILRIKDDKKITCDIAVTDGTFFFGKYVPDNNEHLGPEELKKLVDSWKADKNYLISLAPYYYSKTTDELRELLPPRYYIPDDFTSFTL